MNKPTDTVAHPREEIGEDGLTDHQRELGQAWKNGYADGLRASPSSPPEDANETKAAEAVEAFRPLGELGRVSEPNATERAVDIIRAFLLALNKVPADQCPAVLQEPLSAALNFFATATWASSLTDETRCAFVDRFGNEVRTSEAAYQEIRHLRDVIEGIIDDYGDGEPLSPARLKGLRRVIEPALSSTPTPTSRLADHLPSREALRRQIAADPDLETEATPTLGHCPLHGSYPVAPSRCPTCKKAGRPPTPEELQAWGVVPDSTPTPIDGEDK